MKIGIDASRIEAGEKLTGVGRYALQIISHLRTQIPEDVQVILYSRRSLREEIFPLPKNWQSKILHWPPRRLWTQIRLSFEMFFHPVDVLFVPAHVLPLIRPAKSVSVIHDVSALHSWEAYNWFEKWYSLYAARLACRSGAVIVPSEFVRQDLIKYLGLPSCKSSSGEESGKNIFAIHHGVEEKFFAPIAESEIQTVAEKYNLIPKKYFLFVGRIENKKNTENLVNAFELFKQTDVGKDFKLILVGAYGFGGENTKKLIDNSDFKNSIITPGFLDDIEMLPLLQGSSAFVFPAMYEGFGMPILEAYASGVPILTADSGSSPEIAEDASFEVDCTSPAKIAEGMALMVEGGAVSSEKIQKALKIAREHNWSKTAEITAKILIS